MSGYLLVDIANVAFTWYGELLFFAAGGELCGFLWRCIESTYKTTHG